jgi:ribonuclease PH
MLEKMFDFMPDWLKSKLVIRIVYTAGSFITARVISFLTGDYLNAIAGKFVAASGHLGIVLQFKVVSVDERTLEAAITGALMIAAEFVINHVHENYVKPAVAPASTAAAAAAAPLDKGANQ